MAHKDRVIKIKSKSGGTGAIKVDQGPGTGLKRKKKKHTKKQQELQKTIQEKKATYRNRPQGKTFDAPPSILAKAGMTESKKYGLPYHSKGFKNSKLTEVKPYGGTIDTGFTGWDKKNKGKGFKSGGRAGFQHGGRTNLYEELGRVEAEPSNRNRRAEVSRVHRELNKGYKGGKRVGLKDGGSSNSAGPVLKDKKVGIQIK